MFPTGKVEIVVLPHWSGGLLAAEYDAERDVVRVNARAIERVRDRLGPAAAHAFFRCALVHERFHRDHPEATEADARAFVFLTCGDDPERFEAVLASDAGE